MKCVKHSEKNDVFFFIKNGHLTLIRSSEKHAKKILIQSHPLRLPCLNFKLHTREIYIWQN
jgi:hypothetical protein